MVLKSSRLASWLGIATLVLTLSACGGSKGTDSAATTPQAGSGSLISANRTIPQVGEVEGASAKDLAPGLASSVKQGPDGLALSVDRNALLQKLGPHGQRIPVGNATPDEKLNVAAPSGSGSAVYYEASPADGGNKVTMGAADITPGLLPCPILFIRQNETDVQGPMMTFRNLQSVWNEQNQAIMRLDPDGTLTQVLAISGRPMQDLEVSPDAKKVMFSMREFGGNDMELFEMNIDGTNLTQLTFNDYDDGEPTYLPDGRVLFTSERDGVGDFYDCGTEVPQMFVLDRFTGEERLVHLAADGCFNPIVAHDGRVYFVSWDTRINISGPRFNRFVIWRMDPDGTDSFPVFGSHIARDDVDCFIDVRETADNQLLCVHTNFDIPGIGRAHHENYGSGSIMKVDPQGNPDFPTYKYLTPREIVDSGKENTLGRYKFPMELPGGDILVTYAPGDVWDDMSNPNDTPPDFGLYILHNGTLEKLCDAPGIWELGGVPLIAHAVPPVIPDETLGKAPFGEFACENIFDRQGDQRQGIPLPENGPFKVRVFQALKTNGVPTGDPGRLDFEGRTFQLMTQGPVIGEYPVASDGSFRIRIPADTPITWELIDGKGRVTTRERMFNMVRPGELRSCAGCHARIDIAHNVDQSKMAFQPGGQGYSDLRGLFEDFVTTVVDNSKPGEISMKKNNTTGGASLRGRLKLSGLTLLCCLAVLLLQACGGSSAARQLDPAAGTAPGKITAPASVPDSPAPTGFAALPKLPGGERKVSQTALTMNGSQQLEAYSGAEPSGNRLVLDGSNAGGNGLAWSMYEFSTTDTAKYPVQMRVTVGVDSAPYWLAIGDYATHTWDFSGPYTDMATMPLLPLGTSSGDYVSPGGSVYAAVLSYNPAGDSRVVVDQLELKLSQNPPPGPPTGLQATVLQGSVRLTWNAGNPSGLLGYNVYFSTESFNVNNQNLVARDNIDLVPVSPNPSYELTELTPGKNYYFRVAAVVGDQVESALSNQVLANTSYSLYISKVFPPEQYPGFWVYVEGAGYDPSGTNTQVYWNNSALPAASVKNVSPGGLRFRVPLDAPIEQACTVQVKVAGSVSAAAQVITMHPKTPPKNWAHIGKTLYQSFEMYSPQGVATDNSGNLYVAQGDAGRISVYDPQGNGVHEFYLSDPQDIEVLGNYHILVKQGGGNDVYDIDQNTGIITSALDPAVVDANFNSGYFLAATSDGGTIYLSDADAGLIRKFVNGAHVLDIGAGKLDRPYDVELDSSGNLVVADVDANSIFWFDANGGFIAQYDGSADLTPDDGELRGPIGVACFADGSVCVTDQDRDRVLRFDAAHHFAGEWGQSGYSEGASLNLPSAVGVEGRFWSLWGIAALPGGKVLVSDEYNDRTGIFDKSSGQLVSGLMDYTDRSGEFIQPQSFAVRESDGAYAVLDGTTYTVTLMDRHNAVLHSAYLETGIDGDILTGRMDRTPSDIAWSNGELYFTHGYTKLTEYSDDFSSYKVLGVDWGTDPTEFKGNGAMATDGNILYALDRDNDRIQVFNSGTYDHSIALPDPGNTSASSMVLDKEHGWFYLLDRPWNSNSRVLRINASTGALVDSWEPGFGLADILAIDPAGYIYVYYWDSDGLLHKLQPPALANGTWNYMCGLAPYGDEDGAVRNIQGVTISCDGRYLIGDRTRRQIVILAP